MTIIVLTPTQIQKVLTENQSAPPEPALPPDPVAPPNPTPEPTPLPPVPAVPEPVLSMQNMRFRNIFGSRLAFGTPRPNVYPLTEIRVYKQAVCIEITLPEITELSILRISKASSRLPSSGVMNAQFSWHRDFSNPISSVNWGNTSLDIRLNPADSKRTLFLNVKFNGSDMPWGLNIQPVGYEV